MFGDRVALGGSAKARPTKDAVKQKGYVSCGVSTGQAGFSQPDNSGRWSGLDSD
jgi:general L-amino acid transport system substrate-binding protein